MWNWARAGYGAGLAMGFYNSQTGQLGSVGFYGTGGAAGASGITSIISLMLFGPTQGSRQIALGFGGMGGFFVGYNAGEAMGDIYDAIIDAIYEG
jgi:hypothetical protein